MEYIKRNLIKLYYAVFFGIITKEDAELNFWKKFILELEAWYKGDIKLLFGEPSPSENGKVSAHTLKDSSILTWFNVHQKTKYLEDLILEKDSFSGMKILDIGSGPFPSALAFENCEVYCLDPLLPNYIKIGFPIHYYDRAKFIAGLSEDIPIKDNFFDAIISVNAIDHVNDIRKTALEIKRVLKPDGKLRMHVHYHKKTSAEPVEINDSIMFELFGWCKDFKKISESKNKRGYILSNDNESYSVWSN